MTFNFDFFDTANNDPARTLVNIRVVDIEGAPVAAASIAIRAVKPVTTGFLVGDETNALIPENIITKITDVQGRTSANLIRSSGYKGTGTVQYEIVATQTSIQYSATMLFTVPDLLNTDLNVLVSPEI